MQASFLTQLRSRASFCSSLPFRVLSSRRCLRGFSTSDSSPPSAAISLAVPSSSVSSSARIPKAFHRHVKVSQRDAASRQAESREYDYIRDELARRTLDRLLDIKRTFPTALDLGANTCNLLQALDGQGGIEHMHVLESSRGMLYRDAEAWRKGGKGGGGKIVRVSEHLGDEEGILPFRDGELDAVLSSCSLHWQNDLPGIFRQALRVLKPDGVFLGNMLGGDTLLELRSCFIEAETEVSGGVSPHVSPMVAVPDIGNLLAAAGFGMPTVDSDIFTIEYPDPRALMRHLQRMGESNACVHMRQGAHKRVFSRMVELYQERYGNADGSITATFQAIFFIGWAPAPSQPRALRRGSVAKGFGARGSGPPPTIPPAGPPPTATLPPT